MSKSVAPAAAGVLLAMAGALPAVAQERAPPGCRWQEGAGGMVMACKDADGYWRRTGDGEIVGYDPPPRPARPPPPSRPSAPAARVAEDPPPVVESPAAPAPPEVAEAATVEAVTPPEPPMEPAPPRSPLEAFLRWLLDLWRAFRSWLGTLF